MRIVTDAQKHHIQRLLTAGMTLDNIARLTGVSRRTVARISRGHRRMFSIPADPPPGYSVVRLARCPGCGGLNYRRPCLRCRLNNQRDVPAKVPKKRSQTPP